MKTIPELLDFPEVSAPTALLAEIKAKRLIGEVEYRQIVTDSNPSLNGLTKARVQGLLDGDTFTGRIVAAARECVGGISMNTLEGIAVAYNEPVFEDGVIKIIAAGAFDGWLAYHACKIAFCLDHDESKVVGDLNSGLRFRSDHKALHFRFTFPDHTTIGREAKARATLRIPQPMSIHFHYPEFCNKTVHGVKFAVVEDARLDDLSMVHVSRQPQAMGKMIH